jgi:hypothetical protein
MLTKALQIFFANRVRVLSGRWLIASIFWALILVRAAMAITGFGRVLHAPRWSEFAAQTPWFFGSVLGIGAGTDVLVAASQCYYLWQMRVGGIQPCVWMSWSPDGLK